MSESPTPHQEASWKGLLGCLVGGTLVLLLLIGTAVTIHNRQQATETRILAEWLNPWLEAVRGDDMAAAWAQLTTESYRGSHSQVDLDQTYRTAVERWGKPTEAVITSANSTTELGADRTYQQTVTRWTWENGQVLYLTFKLVDVSGQGFRLDGSALGGRNQQISPSDTPPGPW